MSDTAFLERRRARFSGRPSGGGSSGVGGSPGAAGERALTVGGWDLPPIRIPVTPANQSVLRELRARELALWEGDAAAGAEAVPHRLEVPRDDRESQVILLLLGGAALALWLQATTAAVRFVDGWETFVAWVEGVLR